MRYYSIIIPGAPGDIFPVRYDDGAIWGSHKGGVADPGAQQVEIQITETAAHTADTDNSTITIHGVSWEQIRHTDKLMKNPIMVYGGMKPGLPLATAQSRKAGLLMSGRIWKAWGNWIGTDMSIGLAFLPAGLSEEGSGGDGGDGGGGNGGGGNGGGGNGGGGGDQPTQQSLSGIGRRRIGVGARSIDRRPYARGAVVPLNGGPPVAVSSGIGGGFMSIGSLGAATSFGGGFASSLFGGGVDGLQAPLNLIHNMMPNMPMKSAIQQTLSKAFPRGNVNMMISSALKLPYQDAGMYQNMPQYANYIKNISHSLLGAGKYLGVNMTSHDNTINVWDGTQPGGAHVIEFLDLIGQPTWLALNKIQVKCVMRGDIHPPDEITLPEGILATLTPEAIIGYTGSQQRTNITLPGSGIVTKTVHIGDFRNPDGVGWSSTYDVAWGAAADEQSDTSDQVDQSSQNQNPVSQITSEKPPVTEAPVQD